MNTHDRIQTTPQSVTVEVEKPPRRVRSERGQSTAEYALLILGVATIALLVLAWAGSTGAIGNLFDRVVEWVTSKVV
jgi:predicted anti-sigma-YlaC factor YlaD